MNAAEKGKVEVCWERQGNCLWHSNCTGKFAGSGVMKPGRTEGDKTLLTCLSCGAETWAQHGMHDRVIYAFPPAASAA